MILKRLAVVCASVPLLASCSAGDERPSGSAVGASGPSTGLGRSASPVSSAAATAGATSAGASAGASVVASPPKRTGTIIRTGRSQFGEVLFDVRGQAVYLFAKERTTRPDCYDECAIAWPPVLTSGLPQASGGVSERLLGSTMRNDGSLQVTYGGHPLYFYAHEGPDEVTCHNVSEFGGLWLVLDKTGRAKA